jgi:hypothetical protein
MIPRGLALLALCLTVACSSTSIYQMRGTEEAWDPGPGFTVEKLEQDRNAQLNLEARSIEKFQDFELGVIEITEDGLVNPAQQKQVMDMVQERLKRNSLLIVFAHGWHHGARVCDNNLACFRRVLEKFATMADLQRLGVKVTGVYIGWRGESWRGKVSSNLTIWGRKGVGQHIGRTGAKEVLLELDRIHKDANRRYGNPYNTMVTVGHSLGGGLIFSAMKGIATGDAAGIIEGSKKNETYRVVRAEGDRTKAADSKAIRARLGDLVVLVNPAIEASEYRTFNADLPDSKLGPYRPPPDRTMKYDDDQLPVLLAVGAEADAAVGTAFRLGQTVSAFLRPGMFADPATRIGIGHYQDHITHDLHYPTEERAKVEAGHAATQAAEKQTETQPECDCPYDFDSTIEDISDAPLKLDERAEQSFGSLKYTVRRPETWDVHSPYLVVRASPGVLTGHNDIYNPVFVSYLSKFIRAYVAKAAEIHQRNAAK